MQIFTSWRDSSKNTGVLFVCYLRHLQFGYRWVTGGGQSSWRSFHIHTFGVVTQFGNNYARINLQLIVIYIIYTLLHIHILHNPEPFPNNNYNKVMSPAMDLPRAQPPRSMG